MHASDLGEVIELTHKALDAFVKGSPTELLSLYSRRDDVTIANPFGPPAVGWAQASATMERAATNYREGEALGFERVSGYETPEVAYTVEIERYRSKIGGAEEITPVSLRVTTIFRREADAWRIIHRHADTITSPQTAESLR